METGRHGEMLISAIGTALQSFHAFIIITVAFRGVSKFTI
jgi:hypothetical protein